MMKKKIAASTVTEHHDIEQWAAREAPTLTAAAWAVLAIVVGDAPHSYLPAAALYRIPDPAGVIELRGLRAIRLDVMRFVLVDRGRALIAYRDKVAASGAVPVECNACGATPIRARLITDERVGDQCPCCYIPDMDCDGTLVARGDWGREIEARVLGVSRG